MGKNITVYISDVLALKMEEFEEVNWSEIARQGIERYVGGRVTEVTIKNQVPDNVLNEFRFYLESLKLYMNNSYVYSIANMHSSFDLGVTAREHRQFQEIFDNIREDYSDLDEDFKLFKQKRRIDEFESIFLKLMRVVRRYSKMVIDFAFLVKEKIDTIKPIAGSQSRAPHEYLDQTYANFRERYNNLVTDFVKFVFVTRGSLHKQLINEYEVYQLLAPRLVDFRLSTEKEKT